MQLLRKFFGPRPSGPATIPDHDLSQQLRLSGVCKSCNQRFDFDRFAILDVEHQPAELERAGAGELATARCGACGSQQPAKISFLLVTRSRRPHLFFICEDSDHERNEHNINLMIGTLRHHAGEGVKAWFDEPLKALEHHLLPYLLEPFDEPDSDEWVTPLQWQLLQYVHLAALNHAAEGEMVNRFPEICWAPARNLLRAMLERAESKGDELAASRFRLANQKLDMIRLVNRIDIGS